MDAAGPVDAQNAPTAPWKTAQNAVFHKRPQPSFLYIPSRTTAQHQPLQRVARRYIIPIANRVFVWVILREQKWSNSGERRSRLGASCVAAYRRLARRTVQPTIIAKGNPNAQGTFCQPPRRAGRMPAPIPAIRLPFLLPLPFDPVNSGAALAVDSLPAASRHATISSNDGPSIVSTSRCSPFFLALRPRLPFFWLYPGFPTNEMP